MLLHITFGTMITANPFLTRKVLDQRDEMYEQMSHYLQLQNIIERLQEASSDKEMKMQVDLGCNFYVEARVPDASRIFVAVGYGFFVEFTHEEALRFIDKKVKRLTECSDVLTKDSAKIKANIKIVLEGLRELQHLPDFADECRREVL
uniref:Protein UXT n=1 Tax=Eptatretus burgeri TaxID=7764 RepID=A0A8C4X106_EPTBU